MGFINQRELVELNCIKRSCENRRYTVKVDALNRIFRAVIIPCRLPNDADVLERMERPKFV
jgi:hypothetical protein